MSTFSHYSRWFSAARNMQDLADSSGIGRSPESKKHLRRSEQSYLQKFDAIVTTPSLVEVTRKLFSDGHYARAVEEAYKFIDNSVKSKAGLSEGTGAPLMQRVFSANDPILYLNSHKTQSDRDEQIGYMQMFAGSMTGIRNPRAHDSQLVDGPEIALELLTLANHLMRKLDAAGPSKT